MKEMNTVQYVMILHYAEVQQLLLLFQIPKCKINVMCSCMNIVNTSILVVYS